MLVNRGKAMPKKLNQKSHFCIWNVGFGVMLLLWAIAVIVGKLN